MNTPETIGLASTVVGIVVLLGTLAVSRYLPARAPLTTVEQSRYLMDQLITEQSASRQLRTELDALKGEVTQLRTENTALKAQIATLWDIVRGQSVAKSSADDAARPIQPGKRTQAATATFSDDDVAFRDWIIRHFDGEELAVLAANAGMDKPVTGPITSMATALVQASRRTGMAERLQREALDMRQNVEAW